MKTNYNVILTLLLAFTVHFAFAQKTITGVVSDETGPLPGVSVLIKGTTTGTETDFDGNYAIQANQGQVLQYSFIGMETAYKTVGNANILNIVMSISSDNLLEEVVVTALGIKREKKSLGYAVSTVKTEELVQKPEGDISRILQGKVAGVNITPTGGLAGSGNTVIIRSKISLTGSNQPLYVVDGVPINTDTDNNGNFTQMNGGTTSSRSLDIDPNNIETMTVLKGLSATVLYGNEGRNGVILITTKNGNTAEIDKGFEITFSNTVSISQISNLPDYQNTYGQGALGNYNRGYVGNWGPKFDPEMLVTHNYNDGKRLSELFPEYSENKVPYVAVPNNVKDFFRDGLGTSTAINVNKGGEKASVNFSFSRTKENGYVPENSLERNTLGLGGTMNLSNNFSVNGSFNYVNTNFVTPPIMASSGSSIFARTLFMPRNFDLMNLPFESPLDGSNVYYRTDQDNPRWLLKNASTTQGVNRFFGKVGVNFKLNDHFNATYRLGLDEFTETEVSHSNKGGATGLTLFGFLTQSTATNKLMDHSFIITGKDFAITEDLGFNVIVGLNAKGVSYHQTRTHNTEQVIFNIIHADNFRESNSSEYIQESNTLGAYGNLEFDYAKYLYLTLAGRNDWTSTLETENNKIFYPSVSLAFIPTQAFGNLKSTFLSFLKIRGGYATSAGFPNPYSTRPSINLNAIDNGGILGGITTQSWSNLLPNPDLRPELHKESEIGIEGKLFNNRIDFDISLYKRISKDQIMGASLDPATGYSFKYLNAGRVDTKGIEIGLNFKPIKTELFKWDVNSNFTAYESTVIKLIDGQESLGIAGYSNLGNFAIEGEPLGVIMGSYTIRDENNNYMIDYTDGTVINSYDIPSEVPSMKIIGDPNPDWSASVTNSLNYKNFSLSAQMEYTQGGDVYSMTASRMWRRGVTTANLMDREGAVVLPGTLADPDTGLPVHADGTPLAAGETPIPNTIPIAVNSIYFINTIDNAQANVYDATRIRLRDITISYKLNKELLDKTPFGSISLSLTGQNLWFKAFNFPDAFNFDPEVISTGAGNGDGLEFQTAPSSKKYGFSIKATF